MAGEQDMGGKEGAKKEGSPFAYTKIKAEHEVKEGETLSGIALKYYGSAEKEKWMKIYQQNKNEIGDDPGLIKPGMKLNIPELD